ncbi:MAG: RimK family alpha-L-glutamate ligase [Clostridia bacterium]|nr:RimK family alpha-L-glutamate ligase [Clostridia bacterium]
MKKGLILINAYLNSKSQFAQAERMQAELENLGVCVETRHNDGFFAYIKQGEIALNLPEKYDFCVYLDKDKYMSEMLEKTGLRLFNRHAAIRDCDDKMQTYLALAGAGIDTPKTLSGLLCYNAEERVRQETAIRVEQELGYPVIVKESFGSLGKGVYMARNRAQLLALMETLKCRPHLFQAAVKESLGRDIRVIVVGGKVFAAMERKSDKDFRSNIELGGTGSVYEPSEEIIKVCERAAARLSLDYCGVDILLGEGEKPLLCEVNSNAYFNGLERVTGKNVAHAYAEHIVKEVYGI